MAAADQILQSRLSDLAAQSNGSVGFSVITNKDLEALVGSSLPRTPNPIYKFEFQNGSAASRAIAYTLALNGAGRGATRCESLARAVVQSNGGLFKENPFLLVYDYAGNQFLAVSALALFDTFAKKVADAPLEHSETANFSLTPNFKKGTVFLYGQVPASSVWSAKLDTLTPASLAEGLSKLVAETTAGDGQIAAVTAALKNRIENRPTASEPPMTLSIPVGNEPEDIQVPERVRSMLRRSIRSSTAVILVGPPGTGKTALLREAVSMFAADAVFTDTVGGRVGALWSTPDESWSARELVGGETVLEGEICFAPGCVLRAIADNRWLILDETNRADMDRIFGGLLTWLSGGTIEIGRASAAEGAPTIELGWADTRDCKTIGINEGRLEGVDGKVKYLAGTGWRLLGTYNALDAQRVFRFGAALGRRFARVPIPAAVPEVFTDILGSRIGSVPEATRSRIVGLYTAHHINPLTQLGPAVFLAVGRYVAAALGETPAATENVLLAAEAPAGADEAVAEGYVVSVGTWLAHLEPKDRDELRSRTIKNGALTEADWTWILLMIQSLA